MTGEGFGCPNCAAELRVGVDACARCGLRLRGPEAGRLWEVDQELARLGREREGLITALLGSGAPAPASAAVRREHRRLSGQQLLLGLGALLLLSAASFFLVVVWIVVGLVGQAAIMLALTVAAAAGARIATRRRLPAAAETGAVLTTGLLLVDAWAAHALGLAGLDEVSLDLYGAVVTPILAAALLGADRWVPRTHDGAALRPVLTYRPAATAMLALTPWCLLSLAAPAGTGLVACFAAVTVVDAAVAAAAHGWFRAPVRGLSEAPAAIGALVAGTAFVALGLVIGYDPGRGLADRWTCAALLGAALLVAVRTVTRFRSTTTEGRLAVGSAAVAVLGIPLMDAPAWVLVALSLLAAAVGSVLVRIAVPAGALVAAGYVAVLLVRSSDVGSLHALTRLGLDDATLAADGRDVAVMVLPALGAAALSLSALARTRRPAWVAAAQFAVLVTVVTALAASPAIAWTVTTTLLAAVEVALAAGMTLRRRPAALGPTLATLAATAYGLLAVFSAVAVSAELAGLVLVVLGVTVLGYAACPGRLALGYAGSLLVSAGVDTWLATADVDLVEAYTVPLSALLAALGAAQWSRDHRLPTTLTAGPALAVALVPSTVVAVSGGNAVRLAAVTGLSIVALVAGLARSWRAPVTVGAFVLAVVALTQGGPLIGYVPGWVTLGVAGAALLAIGVAWERAVLAGRRAHAWYATLH